MLKSRSKVVALVILSLLISCFSVYASLKSMKIFLEP